MFHSPALTHPLTVTKLLPSACESAAEYMKTISLCLNVSLFVLLYIKMNVVTVSPLSSCGSLISETSADFIHYV